MANKVLYGLKNVHVCSVTETAGTQGTVVTFGTPQAIPGAVNMSLEASGDTSEFFADNTKYYVAAANNGYEGTLEVAVLPEFFYTSYLGETVDEKGNITERSIDKQKNFALLFQVEGDDKAQKFAYYYCKAKRPAESHATIEAGIEPGTQSLDFTAIPLPDGSNVIKSRSTSGSTNYATWFTAAPTVPTFDE